MSVDDRSPETIEDPIAYFLQDITYHGKSQRTHDAYDRVLRRCESHLETNGVDLSNASTRDCMSWVHSLRDDHADSTVATYASYVHRFYSYMMQVELFERNPMALVIEEMDESIDTDPSRRDLDVPAMRIFLETVGHPLDRAVMVMALKTGMRVGELCNLDIRDIHLASADVHDAAGVSIRGGLDSRPDSIFVSAAPERGATYNGERRTASNKRKRDTVVPIDRELARVLRTWLLIRPDTRSDAEPLFLSTRDSWGQRLTPGMVRNAVRRHASAHGWHAGADDAASNVTPHYFRHFFTTHMRSRTGDRGIVKYLRGDVASDIIDTYTHNWGGRVRETYEREIYSLLV